MKQLSCALAVLLAPCAHAFAADRPPNFVIIYADDLGYGDLGCYGSKHIKTPRLDRMAEQGVRFTRYYSLANICSPSRAALLTGCYPQRCGFSHGLSPLRERHKAMGLNPDEVTIAEKLKTAGYTTGCIGKWHLGDQKPFLPTAQGFDSYFGLPWNYTQMKALMRDDKVIEHPTPLAQVTRKYTEEAVRFIKGNRDKPFFLYFAHTYPHTPFAPHPDFKGKSGAGDYGDVILEVDWSVGQVLDALHEVGLDERTLVIFTSDNGPTPAAVKRYRSAGPLRGSKYVTEEGGHRVPCIARWPGKVPAGRVSDHAFASIDFFPTFAKLAGVEPASAKRPIDGRDALPILIDADDAVSLRPVLYYYNDRNLQAVREGPWKLHLPREPRMLPFWQKNKGIRSLKKPLLYHLTRDPGSRNNVADEHPDTVKRLLSIADEAQAQFGDYDHTGTLQRPRGVYRGPYQPLID